MELGVASSPDGATRGVCVLGYSCKTYWMSPEVRQRLAQREAMGNLKGAV